MAEGQGGDKGYQFACSLKELEQLGRKRVAVEERVVVVFHIKGQIYAMDHFCYRKLTKQFINTDTTNSISIIKVSFYDNITSHRRRRST